MIHVGLNGNDGVLRRGTEAGGVSVRAEVSAGFEGGGRDRGRRSSLSKLEKARR